MHKLTDSNCAEREEYSYGTVTDKITISAEIIPHYSPRFDIGNKIETKQMLDYLEEFGYAVIAGAASIDQISNAKSKFWSFQEEKNPCLKRNDSNTWTNSNWLGNKSTGIISSCGFNHSEFTWDTRLLPKVKETFSKVWNENNLIVSFDAGNVFRPWRHNPDWMTMSNWWHVDQNSCIGISRQGRVCVQGLVTYYDATPETGGLCVIPKSHRFHEEICENSNLAKKCLIDFVDVSLNGNSSIDTFERVLICAKAGDLILWDSRTVHCNTPGVCLTDNNNDTHDDKHDDIIRLVSYVCMVPRYFASSEVIRQRKVAFRNRMPTSHWPHKAISVFDQDEVDAVDISTCSDAMLHLVGYTDLDCFVINISKALSNWSLF